MRIISMRQKIEYSCFSPSSILVLDLVCVSSSGCLGDLKDLKEFDDVTFIQVSIL